MQSHFVNWLNEECILLIEKSLICTCIMEKKCDIRFAFKINPTAIFPPKHVIHPSIISFSLLLTKYFHHYTSSWWATNCHFSCSEPDASETPFVFFIMHHDGCWQQQCCWKANPSSLLFAILFGNVHVKKGCFSRQCCFAMILRFKCSLNKNIKWLDKYWCMMCQWCWLYITLIGMMTTDTWKTADYCKLLHQQNCP